MTIPIKLLAGNDGEISVDLDAQSIDIAVDRNVSAFPTPGNVLKRISVDTNIPRVTMEINGILSNDEGADISGVTGAEDLLSVTPMRTIINFGSILPTQSSSTFKPVKYATSNGPRVFYTNTYTVTNSLRKNSTDTISNVVDGTYDYSHPGCQPTEDPTTRIITGIKFTDSYSIGATGALDISAAVGGVSVIPSLLINIGDRIENDNGDLLGIVQSVTGVSVTFTAALSVAISVNDRLYASPKCFNYKNEFLGFVTDARYVDIPNDNFDITLTLDRKIEADVLEGTEITLNKSNDGIEDLLNNEYIKLVPSYWLEDPSRGPTGSLPDADEYTAGTDNNYGIKFIFDATKTPVVAGGSATPQYESSRRFTSAPLGSGVCVGDAAYNDIEISIPIKGLATASGSPAANLAEIVESAFQLGDNLLAFTTTRLNPEGDSKLFNSGQPTTFRVTRSNAVLMIEQIYKPDKSIEHPRLFSQGISEFIESYNSTNSFSSFANKSAGDKAQDLIGLISNSSKTSGDLFTGIQIPYDSLITSSGVTSIARNFFLTFGEIPASEKGSIANNRAASEPMHGLLLTGDAGGNKPDFSVDKDSILREWFGSIVDDVTSLIGFVTSSVTDIFVTLKTNPHGNDGGIRIMPEKLHVRYDAGNNYYAYSLLLVATDFVIGV
jgi:hypothetical protein